MSVQWGQWRWGVRRDTLSPRSALHGSHLAQGQGEGKREDTHTVTCQSVLRTILCIAACRNTVIQVHQGCAAVPRLQPLLQDLLLQDPQLQDLPH